VTYLLTFACYGTWLHADPRRSVGWAEMLGVPPAQPLVYLLRRAPTADGRSREKEFILQVQVKLGCQWRRWTYQQELQGQDVLLTLAAEEEKPKTASSGA